MFQPSGRYFLFAVLLLAAEALHLRTSERRGMSAKRLVFCVAALLAVSLLIPKLQGAGTASVLYDAAIHGGIFLCSLPLSMAAFKNDFFYTFNRCIHGYVTFACGYVWGMLADVLLDLRTPWDGIVFWGMMTASYGVFYIGSIKRFDHRGSEQLERFRRTGLLLLTAAVVTAAIAWGGCYPAEKDAAVFSFLSVYLCFLLLIVFTDEKHLRDDYAVLQSILEKEAQQYTASKELIDAINLKCHDLKHQVHLLRDGGSPDREELLCKIERTVAAYDSGVKTGNEALDVVLTEKSRACEENGIDILCMADGSAISFLEPTDVYSLIGNLLDNAIEAVSALESPEMRSISFSCKKQSGLTHIQIENYYKGPLKISSGLPVSTKADRYYHGFGTKSAKMIVEKYGGIIKFSAGEKLFSVNVLLPEGGKTTN